MEKKSQTQNLAVRAYREGDYVKAAEMYTQAADDFIAANDINTGAEMRNNASVAYLQAGEVELAYGQVVGTPEIFAQAGDTNRQAMALGNLGAALEALNRLEEAEQAYIQSAELLKELGEDQLRIHVMQSLSALQLRLGRRLEALATMKGGLEDVQRPTPKQRLLRRLLNVPFRMLEK